VARGRLDCGRRPFGVDAVDHRPQPAEAQAIEAEDETRQMRDLGLALFLRKRRGDLEDAIFQDVGEVAVQLVEQRLLERRAQRITSDPRRTATNGRRDRMS
jgi:hypothetical protein